MTFKIVHEPKIQFIPADMLRPHEGKIRIRFGRSFSEMADKGLTPEQALDMMGDPEEFRPFPAEATRRLQALVEAFKNPFGPVKERIGTALLAANRLPVSPSRNEVIVALEGALIYLENMK